MRDRMERFMLLPFSVGCISESSIPIGVQHAKRSKPDTHSTPSLSSRNSLKHRGGTDEGVKEDNEESLTDENLKTVLPRFQKLFQSLSHLFVNKDELEPEMGMEIGLPTDVKHVTHIGLDDCASSIFSKDWNNVAETELIDLHSFHQTALELAMATQDEIPGLRSLLETKCKNYHDNPITSKVKNV